MIPEYFLIGTITLIAICAIQIILILVFHLFFKLANKTASNSYILFFNIFSKINYIILGASTLMIYSGMREQLGIYRFIVMAVVFIALYSLQKLVLYALNRAKIKEEEAKSKKLLMKKECCRQCMHKEFDKKQGIICGLTGKKPNFEDECHYFAEKIT